MKKAVFSIRLTKEEQEQMAERYHFEKTQLYRIAALHEALLPLLQAEGYYEILPQKETAGILQNGILLQDYTRSGDLQQAVAQNEIEPKKAALCAVTLGSGIDDMQALYGGAEAVMDDYILECLGSSLLEKAYEALSGVIARETGLFLNRYLFPGSQTELSQIADIIERLSVQGECVPISCNTDFVLTPKKSVVFIGILEKRKTTCGICADCPKTDCESRGKRQKADRAKDRNYSYGYQRIFGKNDI